MKHALKHTLWFVVVGLVVTVMVACGQKKKDDERALTIANVEDQTALALNANVLAAAKIASCDAPQILDFEDKSTVDISALAQNSTQLDYPKQVGNGRYFLSDARFFQKVMNEKDETKVTREVRYFRKMQRTGNGLSAPVSKPTVPCFAGKENVDYVSGLKAHLETSTYVNFPSGDIRFVNDKGDKTNVIASFQLNRFLPRVVGVEKLAETDFEDKLSIAGGDKGYFKLKDGSLLIIIAEKRATTVGETSLKAENVAYLRYVREEKF